MKTFDFYGKFKIFAVISIIILVVGVICGAVFGLNMGIDFSGGSIVTIEVGEDYDADVVNAALDENGADGYTVVKTGDNYTGAIIRMRDLGGEDQDSNEMLQAVIAKVQETYPDATIESIDRVGATASAELVRNAFLAVVIACALMLVYIWIRFELYSGIAAVVALAHDVGIMLAFVAIFQMQINSEFIAAVLTIVGYSINNTIVIFDRIRDNKKSMGLKENTRAQIANTSIGQTLSRTINTSVTTLIMIVCLYIFGVDSIKAFSLPIIVGLLAGTYSSVFLSGPIWVKLSDKFEDKAKNKASKGNNKNKKTAKA